MQVDEWVFWQMANLGPNAGQRNHFRNYAPSISRTSARWPMARFATPTRSHRLYGVLDGQLKGRDFICGDYSIADMLTWPWMAGRTTSALDIDEFPDVKAWHARVGSRAAVQRAMERPREFIASGLQGQGREAQDARSVLFGQRARKVEEAK